MALAHINIGSNSGDSRSILERAVTAVFSLSETAASDGGVHEVNSRNVSPFSHHHLSLDSLHLSSESRFAASSEPEAALPRRSSVVETEPWGFVSENNFFNVAVEISTSLPPRELLLRLQKIERQVAEQTVRNSVAESEGLIAHRNADGTYKDRLLDIDLIFYDDLVIDTPFLTLPHPRAHLRDFVLLPWLELSPGRRHPVLGLLPAEMLRRIGGEKR